LACRRRKDPIQSFNSVNQETNIGLSIFTFLIIIT
jgi:hypothetical protein